MSVDDNVDGQRFEQTSFLFKSTASDDFIRGIANTTDSLNFKVHMANIFRNLSVDLADCMQFCIKGRVTSFWT